MRLLSLLFLLFSLTPATQTPQNDSNITNRAVAFVYHRFGESKYPSTNIRLSQFQEQLDYLKEHHYNVVPLSQIVKAVKAKESLPPKTVALTIDDAYYSVYTNAFAMLREKGFAFSVFVNTNAIDSGSKNYVTWEQMREMQENGGEFFNHSLTHDYLVQKQNETPQEAHKRIKREIVKAQERLDAELGKKDIQMLAYPFGEYDERAEALLEELGFIGVAQKSGPITTNSDIYALSRFPMNEALATMNGFKIKLDTMSLPIESLTPHSPLLKNQNPPFLSIKLSEKISGVNCFLSNGERVSLEWHDDYSFSVHADRALKGERALYTCTAPKKDGGWYWYSHLWIIAKR